MKTVGSRELKNRLGRYLGLVGRGETIVVTDRGKPVARLVPPSPERGEEAGLDGILKKLEVEGHLRLGTRPFRRFKPIPLKGKPASENDSGRPGLMLYLDASALVKRYSNEKGSRAVVERFESGEKIFTSVLSFGEVHASFARKFPVEGN